MKLEQKWYLIEDQQPPQELRVLVTNNPTAKNRLGEMSHLWIGEVFKFGNGYSAWVDSIPHAVRVEGVKMWHPLPEPPDGTVLPRIRTREDLKIKGFYFVQFKTKRGEEIEAQTYAYFDGSETYPFQVIGSDDIFRFEEFVRVWGPIKPPELEA